MSDEEPKFKHNNVLLHLVLEFLIRKGLLICFTDGVISGKTYSKLYVKVIPNQLENGEIENFVSQRLNLIELNWDQYINTCRKITLRSPSCRLAREVEQHFQTLTHLQ